MLAAIEVDPATTSLVTLEDVLIWKALCGVVVRVVVWRHEWVSWLERLLPNGQWNLQRTLWSFQKRCVKLGVRVKICRADGARPEMGATGRPTDGSEIIFVVVGSPDGYFSC
eukprot:TRINITY_DN20411_c0_g1_i1.p2 TRINITY_DN20411_c0_g1~~TRINITY_DN20411_c0_g1_i1.p2  ORF type:complete len:112 (+),score=5.96 TRINITY_DN20411_c0_g1_i1:103-438(+)